MAEVIVTLLPISIVEAGNVLEVFGELSFDGGDYETGGQPITVVDYTSADLSTADQLAKFLQVPAITASRPPISWDVKSGNGKNSLYVVPLAGKALPAIGVVVASTGAESADETALDSTLVTPPFPSTIRLRYKKSI